MAPAERSESGTFFTPSQLVSAVVRATLAAWLSRRLRIREEDADSLLDRPDSRAREAMSRVTVLDPAVGSGAFLLGALEQLAAVMGGPPAEARRRVLRQNLFGVDLNPAAVRLTELRLWLAVIEPDHTASPECVQPLPGGQSARAGHPGVERQRAAGSRRGTRPASHEALDRHRTREGGHTPCAAQAGIHRCRDDDPTRGGVDTLPAR
jgi:hypothetical protein